MLLLWGFIPFLSSPLLAKFLLWDLSRVLKRQFTILLVNASLPEKINPKYIHFNYSSLLEKSLLANYSLYKPWDLLLAFMVAEFILSSAIGCKIYLLPLHCIINAEKHSVYLRKNWKKTNSGIQAGSNR